jgi:hypothetical protein
MIDGQNMNVEALEPHYCFKLQVISVGQAAILSIF